MGDGADFSVNNDPRMSVREKRARSIRVKPGGTAGSILSQQQCWDGIFCFYFGKHSSIRLRRLATIRSRRMKAVFT